MSHIGVSDYRRGAVFWAKVGLMKFCAFVFVLLTLAVWTADEPVVASKSAAEFAKRWQRTRRLAVGVAEAMPPSEYAFRPDPPSMDFGEQISHIAQTNYAFCAGLKDSKPPAMSAAAEKDSLVKFLADSFDYCSVTIAGLTDEQLNKPHSSPDGRLLGREVLLALYVHMAHHRGQAEVYLRVKGIAPPPYVF